MITLIDLWGNERTTTTERGQLCRGRHSKLQEALEKRAARKRNDRGWGNLVDSVRSGSHNYQLDETATVETTGLVDEGTGGIVPATEGPSAREVELLEASGVTSELLQVHGLAPSTKQEGVVRIIYENLNGLHARLSNNDKLDKAKQVIDELEADIVCYNEHRLNLAHKDNKSGISQLFSGGETEVRAVAAHNKHEARIAGRVQEGGTAMLLFGPLIQQYDFEASGKDGSGLGRWVMMVFRGENGLTTRILVAYNPCFNRNSNSRCSYQQHRRYFIEKEKDTTCPRKRFKQDLVTLLKTWRAEGDRLFVCMDANENIYKKEIGTLLTDPTGLNMTEVVGAYTGKKIGATFFRGSSPIDGAWATNDLSIVGACVMPVGFGVGDHRVFVIDVRMSSMIGAAPPKIIRPVARRLNNKLPRVMDRYNDLLETQYIVHKMNTRLAKTVESSTSQEDLTDALNKLDREGAQYRRHAEKKCRRIKSGRIPFSPEAAIWIRRKQVFESLLRYKLGKLRNRSNLRRTALRCGIQRPLLLTWHEIKARLTVCKEKCEYFLRHGASYRKRHLQNCLTAARRKRNREAETQILEIIRRERERNFWRRMKFAMSQKQGQRVRTVQRTLTDGSVEELTSQGAVEHTIWEEIHGKRFHLAEQAPICQGQLRGEFGYMASSPSAKAVLEGTYNFASVEHEGTRELLLEASKMRQIIHQDSVDTLITQAHWASKWRTAKERTSSSVSNIHFGHYIAGSHSALISHHDAMKTTICLKHGVTLDRWKESLTCILEKEPGNCLITKMRAILLMEADFNATNKIIYGDRMLWNVRNNGLMAEEIFSERGRTAEDGALSKVLFYDIVRQSRKTAAINSVDAANCYDSIAHAIASIVFQACGVPEEGVHMMLSTIQDMKYFLRTAYGDSRNCRGAKLQVKFQGLCQGNGAAPAGWAAISITILNAHKRHGHGAIFQCPVTKESASFAAILFVDDCDLLHIDMTRDDTALVTFNRMQASVTNWGNLLIGSGGSYKPPKCFHHLISFGWSRTGEWFYEMNHSNPAYEMVVPLPDGTTDSIEHLSVFTSKKTLGVWTEPAGTGDGALAAMKEKADEWISRAKDGLLQRRDIWFLLDCQFWPSVGYGLSCNIAPLEKLRKALSKQYFTLLPLGGVIRTAPAPTRQLGRGFYGVGCPDPGIECCIGQIGKLLMHFGCPSNVGLQMKTSFQQLVLELGLTNQPFQEDFKQYKEWVTWSWMASLWEKCHAFELKVTIGQQTVKMQRERDKWLMAEFMRIGYVGVDLRCLNRVRLHQQALFLSDVIGVTGRSIDDRYLQLRPGTAQWSNLGYPTESPCAGDLRLWRQALQRLVPTGGLSVHLGRFLFDGYKQWEWKLGIADNTLTRCLGDRTLYYEQLESGSRLWQFAREEVGTQSAGLPCAVRPRHQDQVSLQAVASAPTPATLPATIEEVLDEWGHTWLWRNLQWVGEEGWLLAAILEGTCIAVADGSYIRELYPDLCSCAMILECTQGNGRIWCSIPEWSEVACAYRGELLGLMAIHLILLAANRVQANLYGSVKIYSDCLGALKKITSLPATRLPSGAKHSDILKNILVHCKEFSFDIEYLHVAAHQDDDHIYQQLPRPSQLNCCMDVEAKRVIWGHSDADRAHQEIFPLEPVAVFAGQDKVTSGSDRLLRFWCERTVAKEILAQNKVRVLSSDEFEEVHWPSVYQANHKVPRLFQIWACKQVLSIAGTNAMLARYTPDREKYCPSCKRCTETCSHILCCAEAGRVDLLHASIDLIDRWLEEHGTDRRLQQYLLEYAHGRGGKTMLEIVGRGNERDSRLGRSMDKIGWRRFMEGMISKEAVEIQKFSATEGRRKITLKQWGEGLVTKLLEATHGQWLYRNMDVHDAVAGDLAVRSKAEIRSELEKQIGLGGDDLEEEDRYLLEINLDELDTSTGEDQAYWLVALRAARMAHTLRRQVPQAHGGDGG